MKKMALNLIIGLLFMTGFASSLSPRAEAGPAFDQTHGAWSRILHSAVTSEGSRSHVKYDALKKNQEGLNSYLAALRNVTSADFASFSENEKLAFLINAYNALTVKLIVDHYPVKSIKDIGGILSSPWKLKFFDLLGERHRLDDIEHEMIRKHFNEPRIHFALVCASKGCPGLRNEAYVATRLDEQLESNAKAFLQDTTRNRFSRSEGALYVSSIFKWYGGDFEKKFGSLKGFLAPRLAGTPAEQAAILDPKTKITYLDYDWTLNE